MEYPVPLMASTLPRPAKLFVEITTRCNIACAMCVKQSDGCTIEDGDMDSATFEALAPALEHANTLILNGIGEPLLHPRLEEFIAVARRAMPQGARIGFQTNGRLLSFDRLEALVTAGLNLISFSLDVAEPEAFGRVREGADLIDIEEALDDCARLRRERPDVPLEVGIEAVLQRSTMDHLPETLAWAADRGVDFALVSHMLAYDVSSRDQAVFDRCTDETLAHYREWKARADDAGLRLEDYYGIRWKYIKDAGEQRLADFVDRMVADAYDKGVFFHLKNLLDRDESLQERLMIVMNRCRETAANRRLRLVLPADSPRFQRRCDFIEEGGTFISWDGNVHPCYFLWHSYSCHVTDWRKYVTARNFGTVNDTPLQAIWDSEDYRTFRNAASDYDYPFCTNCTVAPCDYIDSETFEQDCYTNTIPCGDCQWCLGLFQCLQ